MQQNSSPTRLIALSQGLWTLVDAIDYDDLSAFKWYAVRNRAGGTHYAARDTWEPRHTILMHRSILGLDVGRTPQVDHINLDPLDNRRCNLRLAPTENQWNKRRYSNNTSGFKGVSWDGTRHKWTAQIAAAGTYHHLGRFDDPETAARAYDRAARTFHGEFARVNFPDHIFTVPVVPLPE